jgi:hypothetical protein
MNAAAFHAIGEPANVALFYRPSGGECGMQKAPMGTIGVKFPVWQDREFFPVRQYGRGQKMRIVRAWRLFKQFDLRLDRTLVFKNVEVTLLDGQPMLVLDLDAGKS